MSFRVVTAAAALLMIYCVLCGLTVKILIKRKGYSGNYFWYGFCMGIIAVIAAMLKKEHVENNLSNEFSVNDDNADSGTGELKNSVWKCGGCGRINPDYIRMCCCGMTRNVSVSDTI